VFSFGAASPPQSFGAACNGSYSAAPGFSCGATSEQFATGFASFEHNGAPAWKDFDSFSAADCECGESSGAGLDLLSFDSAPAPTAAAAPAPGSRNFGESQASVKKKGEKKEAAAAREGEFNLRRLTDLQEVDGSWRDGSAVAKAGEVKATIWAELAAREGGALIFATILALAILRAKAAVRKAAWFLIEEKALRWLKTQGVEPESLISRALAEL
jgi:pyruvate/2-oxoglutarate dehydrogenase complex dihydrolipoamide acyltransferase (E2) component